MHFYSGIVIVITCLDTLKYHLSLSSTRTHPGCYECKTNQSHQEEEQKEAINIQKRSTSPNSRETSSLAKPSSLPLRQLQGGGGGTIDFCTTSADPLTDPCKCHTKNNDCTKDTISATGQNCVWEAPECCREFGAPSCQVSYYVKSHGNKILFFRSMMLNPLFEIMNSFAITGRCRYFSTFPIFCTIGIKKPYCSTLRKSFHQQCAIQSTFYATFYATFNKAISI